MHWIVHKFGGSSIKDQKCIIHVADLILSLSQQFKEKHMIIVLSAIGGITDKLIQLLDQAASRDTQFTSNMENLMEFHVELINSLIPESLNKETLIESLNQDFKDLNYIIQSVQITGSYGEQIYDLVSGYGELWSTKIMTLLLEIKGLHPLWLDSREIIISQNVSTGPSIDWESSKIRLMNKLGSLDKQNVIIVPGYIASTREGLVTTLRRNGSDLSAAIYGVLINASEVNIWTDVDGLYSANPKRVPDAVVLDEMSYLETLELAYFGADVLHPSTIAPTMNKNIPVIIRNTFNPNNSGTKIYHLSDSKLDTTLVKGFAAIDSIALINLEGSGMIGVPGISKKLFNALTEADISVMMISQASSEYSICIAVTERDGPKAQRVLNEAFEFEIKQHHIQSVKLETNVGILAAIGDRMVHQPGIAAIFFNALSRARINVRMISQGSSERNISVILDKKEMTRALQAVHSAFYLSHLTLSVGIIGIGLIGATLLDQISDQIDKLRSDFNIDLRINGLASSNSMLLKRQILVDDWKTEFEKHKQPLDIDEFTNFINTDTIPHAVIIDCTPSQKIANCYETWLNHGIHVITPNKKANSSTYKDYKILQKFIQKGPSTNPLDKTTHYFYETTAGAGLPIISTLKDLIKTGDKIIEIEGVLSGTLSFIFNNLSAELPFSEIVKRAKEEGYTEPDPRDDLSGLDIARKLVILAREMGLKIEVDDVKIEKLLPEKSFLSSSIDAFLEDLPTYDHLMSQKLSEATSKNEVLRYVGVIQASGKCDIQLKSYPINHPFANLRGSENVVLFKTQRYHTYPLIVQGPGAGAAVTAAGVFAELLRLADLLGNS